MVRDIFKRVAWMTRYGRISFNEAMSMPTWYRIEYCEALHELISEEPEISSDHLEE